MSFTREQAYAALSALRPAKVFLDSYKKRTLPEHLDVYFGPPEEFFIAPDTQEPYSGGQLIPILDDGNFGIVLFTSATELVQIGVETPEAGRTYFRHWQQYLADLMLRVADAVEDDDRVRRMADLVGFKHTDALFEHFIRIESLTGPAWWDARSSFPFSIPEPKRKR
jgi:hypothetical protein